MNRNAGFPPPPPYGQPPRPPVGPPAPGYGQARSYGEAPGYQPPPGFGSRPAPTAALPAGTSGKKIATILVVGLVLVAAVGAGVYLLVGGKVPFGSTATKPAAVSTGVATADAPKAAGETPADVDVPDVAVADGAGADVDPGCPFTAAQVTKLVGQPMSNPGDTCRFGDGKGVAHVTISTASASTTEITMDYMRDSATRIYTDVEDLPGGAKGWIATKDIESMAMAVTAKGGYTIYLSNFERFGGDRYTPVMRDVIAALPQ